MGGIVNIYITMLLPRFMMKDILDSLIPTHPHLNHQRLGSISMMITQGMKRLSLQMGAFTYFLSLDLISAIWIHQGIH